MTTTAQENRLTEVAARLRMAIVRTARRLRQEAAGAGGTELSPTAAAALATVERHGQLEEAGLVDRAPDPADGRSALVSINAAGRERLRRLRGRKNAYLARRMRHLPTEDVETLERAAGILERILEQPRRQPPEGPQ